MGRLPFDPKRMNAASTEKADAPAKPATDRLTVSQLATLIERTIRDQLPTGLTVLGEIGQFRERSHWYFDLKDEGAVISCVMFAGAARKSGFVPTVGQQVLLTGRIEFYGRQGRTQFMVDRIQPVGEGALDAAFRRLCDELRGLGWFDEVRKRPLPLFPRCVAVVTSRSGAALQDVLDTARRRCPSIPIALVDARVQGDGAAEQVRAAVSAISTHHERLGIDVVLITRGGGSREDLWCFNDRALAEAILKSPIPVVAAIGHETDTTIAELVADLRGATPTQAAMRIFPDAAELRRQIASLTVRMSGHLARRIRVDRDRLRGLARHPFLSDPEMLVSDRRDDLQEDARRLTAAARTSLRERRAAIDRVSARLERHRPTAVYARRETSLRTAAAALRSAMSSRLRSIDLDAPTEQLRAATARSVARRVEALESAARGLDLVGPHSVLSRGFSMTMHEDGRVVRNSGAVAPGEVIQTRLADGGFSSVVGGQPGRFAPIPPPPRARRRRPQERGGKDQMDLFGSGR